MMEEHLVDQPPGFGLQWYPDERDEQYPAIRSQASERTWRYWWPSGWHGDQGSEPWCVEYALWHSWTDGPDTAGRMGFNEYEPRHTPPWLYCEAQKRDPWEGDCAESRYDGTSVRGGAKALREHGYIGEYRWVFTIEELIRALLDEGSIILGTEWRVDMLRTDDEGFVHPSGSRVGAHAYVVNGINLARGVARIKNSWGRRWGYGGYAWIDLDGLDDLMKPSWVEGCLLVPPE